MRNLPTYTVWEHTWKIQGTPFSLKGHSRSAEKSELNLFLDAGIQSYFNPEFIFLSHSHSDHCFALPMLVTAISTHPSVYVPKPVEKLVDDFIQSTFRLTLEEPAARVDVATIIPCGDKDVFDISTKNHSVRVSVFALNHTVSCNGYGFSLKKTKLKSEYQGISGPELGKLRKQGVELTDPYYDDFICYLLDTGHDVFTTHPEVFNYRNIIVECTYLYDDQEEASRCNKHMLWRDLLPFILSHPDNTFVLVHWSLRYKDEEITKFFEEQSTQHGFKNVVCWLN